MKSLLSWNLRPSRVPLALGLSTLAALSVGEAQAQVELGVHGQYNSRVSKGSWGLGARLGGVVHETADLSWQLDGVGEYYFPDCSGVGGSCDAWDIGVNLLARRRFTWNVAGYVGLGALWQQRSGRLEGTETVVGDAWGLSLLAGAKMPFIAERVRPFAEFRFSFMQKIEDQVVLTGGFLIPLGTSRTARLSR